MDIASLIARFRTLGGPQGAAAARALLASINSSADLRMRTPLSQIRDLEAIAAEPMRFGKAEQDLAVRYAKAAEAEFPPKRKFCSTQFNIEGDAKAAILAMAARIPDADLAGDGRETEPHITIKYGIHDDAPDAVARLVEGFGPVRVKLGKTSIFPAKEATAQRGGDQYDVVKIEVEGDDIHRLNKIVSEGVECTDTHPVYKPHVTLAYVKAGEGERFAGMSDVEGLELAFDSFVFSPPGDAAKTTIAMRAK